MLKRCFLRHLPIILVSVLSLVQPALADVGLSEVEACKRYVQVETPPSPVVEAFNSIQLAQLYRRTIQNPIADLGHIDRYDPTGIIGFCFGRAMAAHLQASQMGLQSESIRKLFIVGDLRSSGQSPEWRFHVTTAVKGTDGNWYAIDPVMYEGGAFQPLTIAQWIAKVREGWDSWRADHQPQAKLYWSSPNSILPDLTVLPAPEDGTRLIQLNFDPLQHGIVANAALASDLGLPKSDSIYALSLDQEKQFFLSTDRSDPAPFDFLGITINGDRISYNGYFSDLLSETDWTNPTSGGTVSSPRKAGPPRTLKRQPLGFALDRIHR